MICPNQSNRGPLEEKEKENKCGSLPTADIVGAVGKMDYVWIVMQTCWHWRVKTVYLRMSTTHDFLKNCPQAMFACLRLFTCLLTLGWYSNVSLVGNSDYTFSCSNPQKLNVCHLILQINFEMMELCICASFPATKQPVMNSSQKIGNTSRGRAVPSSAW